MAFTFNRGAISQAASLRKISELGVDLKAHGLGCSGLFRDSDCHATAAGRIEQPRAAVDCHAEEVGEHGGRLLAGVEVFCGRAGVRDSDRPNDLAVATGGEEGGLVGPAASAIFVWDDPCVVGLVPDQREGIDLPASGLERLLCEGVELEGEPEDKGGQRAR